MHPNMLPVMKWGVTTAMFHCRGSGRSTLTPRFSSSLTKYSIWALAFSTVSRGRGPVMPRMGLSRGTLALDAGSEGAMQQLSARPTMTRFRGSKSFQELTIFGMVFPP